MSFGGPSPAFVGVWGDKIHGGAGSLRRQALLDPSKLQRAGVMFYLFDHRPEGPEMSDLFALWLEA